MQNGRVARRVDDRVLVLTLNAQVAQERDAPRSHGVDRLDRRRACSVRSALGGTSRLAVRGAACARDTHGAGCDAGVERVVEGALGAPQGCARDSCHAPAALPKANLDAVDPHLTIGVA